MATDFRTASGGGIKMKFEKSPYDLERGPWAKHLHSSHWSENGGSRANVEFFDGSQVQFGSMFRSFGSNVPYCITAGPRYTNEPPGETLAEMFVKHVRKGVEPDWTVVQRRVEDAPYYKDMVAHEAARTVAIAAVKGVRHSSRPAHFEGHVCTLEIYEISSKGAQIVVGKTDLGCDQEWRFLEPDHWALGPDLQWSDESPAPELVRALLGDLPREALERLTPTA
jgi:hypothetical protein